MSSDMKILLAFLGGAALGAGAVVYMNRDKIDLGQFKQLATDLINRGTELKDMAMEKMADLAQPPEGKEEKAEDHSPVA